MIHYFNNFFLLTLLNLFISNHSKCQSISLSTFNNEGGFDSCSERSIDFLSYLLLFVLGAYAQLRLKIQGFTGRNNNVTFAYQTTSLKLSAIRNTIILFKNY
jgi:hypothetical protein